MHAAPVDMEIENPADRPTGFSIPWLNLVVRRSRVSFPDQGAGSRLPVSRKSLLRQVRDDQSLWNGDGEAGAKWHRIIGRRDGKAHGFGEALDDGETMPCLARSEPSSLVNM